MCGSTVRVPRLQPPANGSLKSWYWCSSGPRNIITVRVRLAASTSMASSFSFFGGVISRSLSGSQRHFTPMLSSTSIIRFTSSIRATRRRVVLPLFSRAAHSRPTAAFLLVFTSISPWSSLPPLMRKLVLPDLFSRTISLESTSPIRAIISRLIFCPPFSMRLTALWLVPRAVASSDCVMPRAIRVSWINVPMLWRYFAVPI